MRLSQSWVIREPESTDTTGIMDETQANPYLRDAVMTATPEQLQLMLYDGAIRNALQARDAILRKDYEASYNKLTRAQHIILEMINGLNHDVNPELCGRMASIYNFLYRKLVDANVERDVKHIDDAMKVLRIERETWQLLVEKVNGIRAGTDVDTYESGNSASAVEEAIDLTTLQAAIPRARTVTRKPVLRIADSPAVTIEPDSVGFSADG